MCVLLGDGVCLSVKVYFERISLNCALFYILLCAGAIDTINAQLTKLSAPKQVVKTNPNSAASVTVSCDSGSLTSCVNKEPLATVSRVNTASGLNCICSGTTGRGLSVTINAGNCVATCLQ